MPEKHTGSKSKKHKSIHKKHRPQKHHSKHSDETIEKNIDVDDIDHTDHNEGEFNEEEQPEEVKLGAKTKERLKKKIVGWMDCDDKIKDLNVIIKKYKDAKKQQEELIITMLSNLGMDEKKIDVHDNDNNLRGRVYRHKSVTRGAIKEDIIKDALMEAIRNERKVDQLVKKIEQRRPVNERYYLKRTKGSQE